MQEKAFENCCGASEIGCFSNNYQKDKEEIQRILKELKARREDEYSDDFKPGILIATTSLQSAAARALRFHKFRKVNTFTNPGTRNKVTLWAKKLVR